MKSIRIRSLCLSWQQKQFFKWEENIFFVKIFGKPVSKFVALFRPRCLPVRKRRKVSLNIGELRWFCLLFSANERIAVGIVGNSSRAYLFVVARVGVVFPQFLWSKQLARSCWSASIRANMSLNTFLQNNFSIVCFLRKHVLGVFFHVFSFLFFFLWALKRTRSWTNVDAFAKVWHTSTGFPKRCDRILISDKDMFKTHLREVYISWWFCVTLN